MHVIWSGSISFGLINIPIQLYSGSQDHAIEFDMLHKSDLSPIRFARICKADGKEIPYKDIVKGYEYEKGEYVVIDEEDFKQVNPEKTNTIEIIHFADKGEIDAIYYEKPYFLEPGKGAGKSYGLLCEALTQADKVGVIRFVMKNREHIGIIKPYGKYIILIQMRYESEIRDMEDIKLPKEEKVNKKELDMALKLVEQQTEKFKPDVYKDEYIKELKQIIDAKIKGVKPGKKGKAVSKPSKVHDIMALLKASLEEKKTVKVRKRA
jgi:DNA end-binding protein Ku